MDNEQLYNQIMSDISECVYVMVDDAYDNALLEQFQSKDALETILEYSMKATIAAYKGARFAARKTVEADIPGKVAEAYRLIKKIIIRIVKDIRESKGYALAKQFLNYLFDQVKATIKKHNTLTMKQLLWDVKVSVIAMGMFGAGYLTSVIQDVKKDAANSEQQTEISIDAKETPEEAPAETPVKTVQKAKKETVVLPVQYARQQRNQSNAYMVPTQKCLDYIKDEEVLCRFPYYATDAEKSAGKITIGWGHVICDNWKDPSSAWYFPSGMSKERQREIKRLVIKYARAGQILVAHTSAAADGKLVNDRIHKNMRNVLSVEEAQAFFDGDIQTADRRVRITLGIVKSPSSRFAENLKINENVKYYCYYNQDIYDMLLSCAFNSGAWTAEVPFVKSLINTRYDKAANCVNYSDLKLCLQKYDKGYRNNNLGRRVEEHNTFIPSLKKTLRNFNQCIDAD